MVLPERASEVDFLKNEVSKHSFEQFHFRAGVDYQQCWSVSILSEHPPEICEMPNSNSCPPWAGSSSGPALATWARDCTRRVNVNTATLLIPTSIPRRKRQAQGIRDSHAAVPSVRGHPRHLGVGLAIRNGQVRSARHHARR